MENIIDVKIAQHSQHKNHTFSFSAYSVSSSSLSSKTLGTYLSTFSLKKEKSKISTSTSDMPASTLTPPCLIFPHILDKKLTHEDTLECTVYALSDATKLQPPSFVVRNHWLPRTH